MSKKNKNKKSSIKDKLKEKTEQSVKNKGNEVGRSYLNFSKLDADADELPIFKQKKGINSIDIIPFWVATDNHPTTKKGEPDYKMEIYVHKNLGPNRDKLVLCLAEMYGKPCPVCEERKRLKEDGADDDLIKKLYAQRRVVYNVIDLDNEDKGIQIFDVSYYDFERNIVDEIADEDGTIVPSDLDEGKTIVFKGKDSKYKGHAFIKILEGSFGFEDREEAYDEEIVDDAFALDELLIVPDYDEVKKLINAVGEEDDFEDDDEIEDDEAEEKPKKKAVKKTKKKVVKEEEDDDEIEEEEDNDDWDDDWDDDDEEIDEEEEEKPKKKRKRK